MWGFLLEKVNPLRQVDLTARSIYWSDGNWEWYISDFNFLIWQKCAVPGKYGHWSLIASFLTSLLEMFLVLKNYLALFQSQKWLLVKRRKMMAAKINILYFLVSYLHWLLKITNIIIKSHVIIVAISVTSKTLFDFPIYRISVSSIS